MSMSRRTRNKYMKIICTHLGSSDKKYLDVNMLHVYGIKEVSEKLLSNIKLLESMGYIRYVKAPGQDRPFFQITDKGRCYFETKSDNLADFWANHAIELIALIVSIISIIISAAALYVSILGLPEQLQGLLHL